MNGTQCGDAMLLLVHDNNIIARIEVCSGRLRKLESVESASNSIMI